VVARRLPAAVWSGGLENWDSFNLFIVGCSILIVQAIMMPICLIVTIPSFKKWSRRERWI
jgi:hypothetical protein